MEDWVEGDPEGVAFDRDAIDSRLHAFDEQARSAARHLAEAIDVILTDCYDDSEEATAFLTVLGDEIDFPVPATLLGAPVVVTGLDLDDRTLELRAYCTSKHTQGAVAFADLTLLTGTVAAWLHAAYLLYSGRDPGTPTLPSDSEDLARWRP